MLRTIGIAAALLAIAPLAQAADNGIYLGAGYAQTDYGLTSSPDFTTFDDEDSGFKLIAGFRPFDSFGIEVSYIDHGDAMIDGNFCPPGVACPAVVDSLRAGAETISGFAVGYLDFPLIDLFAKVGGAAWQFDGRGSSTVSGFDVDESDFDFAWGAGIQARIWSIAARLEYEQFEVLDDEELETISLSFIYTFF